MIIKRKCFIKMLKASCPPYFTLNFKKISLFKTDKCFRIFWFILFLPHWPIYICEACTEKLWDFLQIISWCAQEKAEKCHSQIMLSTPGQHSSCWYIFSSIQSLHFRKYYQFCVSAFDYLGESVAIPTCVPHYLQADFTLFSVKNFQTKKKICLPTNDRIHINKKNKVNLLIGNTISHRCHVGIHILFINLFIQIHSILGCPLCQMSYFTTCNEQP